MLTAVRADVTARLSEVFQLVEHIRTVEVAPPLSDPPEARILRGLFYVHLYAALEYAVNQGVQRFLQAIAALNAPPQHFQPRFFSVALDGNFASFRNVGEEKRWTTRVKLIDALKSTTPQRISSDLFGLYLQNIWAERLDTLFACLDISHPIVPDPSYRLYVDELVEHRNGVAHGRYSALGIGSSKRSPDLLIRHQAISSTCIHILDCLEQQHLTRGVIQFNFRSAYP